MQSSKFSTLAKPVSCLILGVALLAANACSSRPSREHESAEAAASELPSLSAKDSFFDGKIVAEANLGRGFRSGGPGGGPGSGHGPGGGRRHHGGFGGGPGGPGGREDGSAAPMIQEATMPPVALRLRLTNTSKETLEVTFSLCKSELGDFAVRPERLALAPDQTAEPDPMTSRLGLTSDELVLHLALKTNGKVEQKDLILRRETVEAP